MQKIFLTTKDGVKISAKDDVRSGGNNNAEENKKLYDLIPAGTEKKIQICETGGHGTDILKTHPELTDSIKDFISLVEARCR